MFSPAGDIHSYLRSKQIVLGRSLALRTKVYLDLNFWIDIQRAALGLNHDPRALKLLHHLRRGVRRGRLICPVGDTVFMELLKQPFSDDRRIGTARVVDELSLGVSLITQSLRIGTEISWLYHQLFGASPALEPLQALVWTKVANILGPSHPFSPHLDPATMLRAQIAVADELWETSMTDLILQVADTTGPSDDYGPLTEETNRNRDEYAGEITNFKVAYDIELRGAIEGVGDLAADTLFDAWANLAGASLPPATPADQALRLNAGRNALVCAFKDRLAAEVVRTLHIEASLHAALRVDKRRRVAPNDWHDFRHAAAALAYCDIFLTEKPLHELVRRPQLGLLKLNGCRVASTLDDAVDLVRSLG